jgi:type II secretory pathway pseudopilin PulG
MNRFTRIALIAATSCLAIATPGFAQTAQDDARFQQAQQRLQNELRVFQQEFDRYQQASRNRRGGGYGGPGGPGGYYNDDRVETDYEPSRYYREGPNYRERVLSADERVYRGNDGRYYCKRNDGTTGLIVGAVGGGILGNVIDGGHSRGVGTILGAIVGGVAGKSIDQNNQQVKCR